MSAAAVLTILGALVAAGVDVLLNAEETADDRIPPSEEAPKANPPVSPPPPLPVFIDNRTYNYNTNTTQTIGGPTIIFNKTQNNYTTVVQLAYKGGGAQIPPPRMVREADNQKEVSTPVGRSIDLKKPLPDQSLGHLLHLPVSTKPLEMKVVKPGAPKKFQDKIKEFSSQSRDRISQWILAESQGIPPTDNIFLWDSSITIMPEAIKGFKGKIGISFGLKSLALLSRWYGARRANAYFPIRSTVPTKYILKEFDPTIELQYLEKTTDLQFCSLSKLKRVYDLLGGDKWAETEKILSSAFLGGLTIPNNEDPRLDSKGKPLEIEDWHQLTEWLSGLFFTKLGLDSFPADVPSTLLAIAEGSKESRIRSLSSVFFWFVRQVDALVGEFPVKIDIEDSDPLKEGEQKQQLLLPNISELLAEIYGLARESATTTNLNLNALLRLAAEVIATKNASLIAQDYARANASYLGYKGNPKKRTVAYNFNLSDPSKLDEIFREVEGYIVGWKDESETSLEEAIQRLLFAAQLIKANFFVPSGRTEDWLANLKKVLQSDSENIEKEWEEWKKSFSDKDSDYNKGYPEVPQAEKWEKS